MAVSLPVVPIAHVTHGEDYFHCAAYTANMAARQCVRRQEQAVEVLRAKDRWMSSRGSLDLGKCKACSNGAEVAKNVAAGATRAPAAWRKGSVELPQRTRDVIAGVVEDCGLVATARAVGLAPGTVKRAIVVGQIRAMSFRRLRKALRGIEA